MAGFSPLVLRTKVPHTWTLEDDFTVNVRWLPSMEAMREWRAMGLNMMIAADSTLIRIEEGFTTDLASSPRVLWWFASPVDLAMAAVVHDKMYTLVDYAEVPIDRRARRREADDVFWMAMMAQPDIWYPRALLAWICVRAFGWMFIRNDWWRGKKSV